MNTRRLRQKILDLAIRGKLAPQDHNEKPASVLLEKIATEHASKSTSDISPYQKITNVPFETPASWEWVPIKIMGTVITGSTPSKSINEYYGIEYPFFKPTDLDAGLNVIRANDNLSVRGWEIARKLPKHSVLITCIGATIGKTGLIQIEGTCNQQINAIISNGSVLPEFLYYMCISEYFQLQIKFNASATTLPILNKSSFEKLFLPLPPLKEQKRIVTVIESTFKLIDEIENSKSDIKTTIAHTKYKILDMAIHGKLVKQDSNDESASVSLEKIAIEHAVLVKAVKIKAPKSTSNTSPYHKTTDALFKIPTGWEWVKLGDIIQLISGQDMPANKYSDTDNSGIPYITGASSIENEKVILNRWTTEPKSIANNGDLLITCKGTVGTIAFLRVDKAHIARQIMAIRGSNNVNLEYIKLYLQTYIPTLQSEAKSMIPGISRYTLLNAPIPLPPLLEQKRILGIIESAFKQLDFILESLN